MVGGTSLDQNEVKTLADALRNALRDGSSEDFYAALWGNAYDYDTLCLGLALGLDQLQPGDWKDVPGEFFREREDMWGFIGKENREQVLGTMRRWVSSPEWQGESYLVEFAREVIDTLTRSPNRGESD